MTVCPSCGQENPDGFKFCGNCGAPLAEPAAAEAEERKLVSVLFCDLVGHTAASDRADPEDVRARLRPYHQLLKREIERYGGTVEKFVGDAVMAVFGAPTAHEDDAERAVRSALRILEAVAELELEVRAAVATGEAVVSLAARPEQGEGIVAGDVVNTASRLQNEAAPGTLVVGEVTYRATRDAIEYEELAPVALKGKAEPEPLWRALRPRARFGVDVEASQTAFVGREHDLALLQNTYERTLREQSVQLVTIVGEPGVGKTRLAAEFRRWLDDRPELLRWRQGRCPPYGEGITFWALGEVVKAEAGILESDSAEQAAAKLDSAIGTLVDEGSEREWLSSRLAPLVGATSEGAIDRGESFAAWRRFLEELAAERPLLLVVEDLHWADDALFEFLEHVVDRATGVPLLVLCTARPELYERNSGWGGGKRNSTTLSLSPLTGDETARLVSTLLARTVLPAETQAALLERSGGNPLYAEEFVRMLTDRGILTREGDLAGDGEIPVPESVQALIGARLDTLMAERKALLHAASVVGKVFWPSAVAAVAAVEKQEVERGLDEFVRKELVRPARDSSVEGEDEFSFWHLLVRDVAYGQIPRAARAEKHRAAAEWIEEIAGERVADHAELLAEHYRQALELALAAGAEEEARELEAKAPRFLELAGDRALNLDAAKAERYYLDALELVPAGTREHAELLHKRGQASQTQGRPGTAELHREAVKAFQRLGDERRAAGVMAHLAAALWSRGETQESQQVLMEALRVLEGAPPSAELVAVYSSLAGTAMTAGRSRDCIQWAESGLPLAETLGLVALKVRLLQFIGAARGILGDPRGLDQMREALRLGLEAGLGPETALAYVNLAGFTGDAEGAEAGLRLYREGIRFCESRGLAGPARWSRGESVWNLYELGRWDEVLRLVEEFRTQEGQIGVLVRTQGARVLAWRGRLDEAAAELSTLLPRARTIGDAQILVPALAAAAEVERLQGRPEKAIEIMLEFEAETQDKPFFRFWQVADVARVWLSVGGRQELSRLLSQEADVKFARFRHGRRSAAALLAETEGDLEEAVRLHGEAAESWGEFGSIVERGHALLARGRCLVALGRSAAAVADLDEARKIFADLAARPLVTEAETLIGAAA